MKAMILAAGLGSRLKHVTSNIPKALVPVGGKPILAWQLESLIANGIRDVLVVTGYQSECIPAYLASQNFPITVTTIHNADFAVTNSSYSFWLASSHLKGDSYLHLNCDILFGPSLLQKLIASPHENVIAIRKDVPLGGHLEHVSLEGDRLSAMSITRRDDSVGKAFGLAKFGSESTDLLIDLAQNHMDQGDRNQHYYGLIRQASAKIPYHTLDATDDFLLEVNTLEDLKRAEDYLA